MRQAARYTRMELLLCALACMAEGLTTLAMVIFGRYGWQCGTPTLVWVARRAIAREAARGDDR